MSEIDRGDSYSFRPATGSAQGRRGRVVKQEDVEAAVELNEAEANAAITAPSLAAGFAELVGAMGSDAIEPLRGSEEGNPAVEVLEMLPEVAKNLAAELGRIQSEEGDAAAVPSSSSDPFSVGDALLDCAVHLRKSVGEATDLRESIDVGIDVLRAFLALPELLSETEEAAVFFEKADRIPKPFRSPGGKAQFVRDLLARIPEHKVYVEAYAGAGTLFWAKEKAEREILSDMNENVVALYRFLQGASDADFKWMRAQEWKYNPSHFNQLRESDPRSLRGRAYRFKYLNLYSMRGRTETIDDSDKSRSQTGALFTRNLERYRDRLKGVTIVQGDALETAKKYDASGVFIYLDPPWQPEQGSAEWKNFDQAGFAKAAASLKGNVLISYQGKLSLGEGWRKKMITRTVGGFAKETTQIVSWNYSYKGVAEKREPMSGCEFCDAMATAAFVWDYGVVKHCEEHIEKARAQIEDVNKAEVIAERECEQAGAEPVSKVSVSDLEPERLREMGDRELVLAGRALQLIYDAEFEGNDKIASGEFNREDLVNAYIFVAAELRRRGMNVAETSLAEEATRLSKQDLATVNPGSSGEHPEVEIDDVLEHFKSFKARMPFLYVVGSLANHGKTKGDIDILVKGPCSPEFLEVIKFRIGRMFPPELSKRISVISDSFGGPFTNHVELADLIVEMRDDRAVKEMRIAKKDDPLLDWPKQDGKLDAVFQYHFRGASLHTDLRMKVAPDFLVGWTLATQRAGAVPDVESIEEAKRIGASFSPDGSRYNKPFRAPAKVRAFPKSRQPVEWLGISAREFKPGEVGASSNEQGVIVAVDRPRVEWGIQKPFFHEYFFTGSGAVVQGIFAFRMLTGSNKALEGEGGDPYEEGARTPEGSVWTGMIAKTSLPYVLKHRAVRQGVMPPDGKSGLPHSLEQATPKEFRFWEAKGKEARAMRDALVDARFFTEENVQIVDGEFRRVVRKAYLYEGDGSDFEPKADRARFVLSWQHWKGPASVRSGPSRQVWHLLVDGVPGWTLQADPLSEDKTITATERDSANRAIYSLQGSLEPGKEYGGEVLNDTKATPSRISIADTGRAEIIDREPGVVRVRFDGRHLRGVYTLTAEEEGSKIWVLSRGEEEPKEANADPWEAGDVELADIDFPEEVEKIDAEEPDASTAPEIPETPAEESLSEIDKIFHKALGAIRKVPVVKAKEERLIYGIVLVPEEVDAQGDIYDEEAIREAAHGFMENFANLGVMHRQLVNGKLKILESFIAPCDLEINGQKIKKGTWLLAVRVVDDELWEDVKSGVWTGFSIGGTARRVDE